MTNNINKNELSTRELHEMMVEADMNTNGAYEHILKYEEDCFWDNFAEMEYTHQEVISMALYGDYRPTDDRVGYDGNGNLESTTEEEYRQELLYYFEEYSADIE